MNELLEEYQNNESQLYKLEKQITEMAGGLQSQLKLLQEKNDKIKEQLKDFMEEKTIKSYENDYIKITYIAPTERNTVDSKKLKEEFSDIYNKCLKTTSVKSSIRIKVKDAFKDFNANDKKEIKSLLD